MQENNESGKIQDIINDYQFSDDWHTNKVQHLDYYLKRFVGQNNLNFLEIGSWEGRSAVWFLEKILTGENCTLFCIDPWDSPNGNTALERFNHNIQISQKRNPATVRKMIGHSINFLSRFQARSMDLIYIDGSHLACDVMRDMILSWRLLKKDGIIVCDDYLLDKEMAYHDGFDEYPITPIPIGPKAAIDGFLLFFKDELKLIHKGWQVILLKC